MVDETMRIGIITYHRSHNYGALLQAMGLRQYLVDKGHEVYFVDYWPIYQERMYQAIRCYDSTRDNVISYLKGVGKDIFTYPLKHRRIQKFRAFIKAHVDPYCIPTTEKLDMMVFGSDQIWRKQERLGKRFDSIYWGGGQFISSKRISYAASMGEVTVRLEDEEWIRNQLSGFSSISVREVALKDALQKFIVDKDIKVVADPTILLGSNRWNAIVEEKAPLIKGEYVLYYNLMGNSFDDGAIKKFAEERGLKLVVLNGLIKPHNYFDDSIYDADPVEMLNLIKNATVVFTSSYHGLVFSLLFERQVYCGFSHNSVRAESLLNGLGLNDRLLKKGDELPIVDIDYARVRPLLQQLAKDSGDWLEKSLDSK